MLAKEKSWVRWLLIDGVSERGEDVRSRRPGDGVDMGEPAFEYSSPPERGRLSRLLSA